MVISGFAQKGNPETGVKPSLKVIQINPPTRWISLWMKPCREARNMGRFLPFCYLPKKRQRYIAEKA